jgi:hypothetical protein
VTSPFGALGEISLAEHEEKRPCMACGRRRLCADRPVYTGRAWLCRGCRELWTFDGYTAYLMEKFSAE